MKLKIDISPGGSGRGWWVQVKDENNLPIAAEYIVGSVRKAQRAARVFIKNYNKNHYEVEV